MLESFMRFPITGVVSRQEQQMARMLALPTTVAGAPRTGGNVGLHADDGLDVPLTGSAIELHGAEHVPVVGQRHGAHTKILAAINQPVDARGAVEQRETAVVVEVDEAVRRLCAPRSPCSYLSPPS